MKKIRINFVVFLFSVCLFGQVKNKEDLKKMSYDELKEHYNKSAKKNEKVKYATLYLNKGKKEKSSIRIAKGFYWFALLEYDIDNKKTLQLLDSVIKYSKNNFEDKFFPAAAYCDKAIFLEKDYRFKEAIKNYNLAEKFASRNNLDYYYVIRENIAISKSENLGEVEEALILYKECFNYFKTKYVKDKKNGQNYLYAIFGLADVCKSLKKIDSCTYYNKLGYAVSKSINNDNFQYIFVLNEGANQVLKKNYIAAIDSIDKALPKLKSLNNIGNVFASYFYYGKAYEGLGNSQQALINYKKVDSMYRVDKKIISPEFTDGYLYLIKHYKNTGDKTNQLKFLTNYMTIDSTLQRNYKELNKLLQKEYDFPHLVKEKETLIQSLNNRNKIYFFGIGLLFIIIVGLIIYQQHSKKIYRLRFEKNIAESNIIKEKNATVNNNESTAISIEENQFSKDQIKEVTINEEIVSLILKKLATFEHEKGFLSGKISVKTLSEDFETNSKYLSKIVNEYKNKTFVNYINDLRIEYAVLNLQESKISRKFTLQALASEYGFNSAESFSTAFSKKTGIKPSYFIKELENKTI
jgi:AraC-like DNA-binding protein